MKGETDEICLLDAGTNTCKQSCLIFTVTAATVKLLPRRQHRQTQTGEIVFSDSFSGTNTNWLTYSEDYGYVNLQDGALHVLNYTNSDYSCDTYPDLSFTDFILEVDMTFIEGSTNNWQSVMARYSGDSLYYFDISADGYYSIGIWDDTAYEYDSLVENHLFRIYSSKAGTRTRKRSNASGTV